MIYTSRLRHPVEAAALILVAASAAGAAVELLACLAGAGVAETRVDVGACGAHEGV